VSEASHFTHRRVPIRDREAAEAAALRNEHLPQPQPLQLIRQARGFPNLAVSAGVAAIDAHGTWSFNPVINVGLRAVVCGRDLAGHHRQLPAP
jgi:hypothetical protein